MGRFFVHSPSLSHYIPCHACSDIHKHATVCIVYGFIFVHKQIYKLHTHTHTIWTWSNICCYSPISFSTFASFLFGIKKNKTIASDPLFCVRLYFTLQQQCFFSRSLLSDRFSNLSAFWIWFLFSFVVVGEQEAKQQQQSRSRKNILSSRLCCCFCSGWVFLFILLDIIILLCSFCRCVDNVLCRTR